MDVGTVNHFDRYCMRIFRAFGRKRPGTGQALAEVAVINELHMCPGVNANKVAFFLGMDTGYMTRIINSLERRGLVLRVPSGHDRRSKAVFLTEEGERLAVDNLLATSDYNRTLLEGLGNPRSTRCWNRWNGSWGYCPETRHSR